MMNSCPSSLASTWQMFSHTPVLHPARHHLAQQTDPLKRLTASRPCTVEAMLLIDCTVYRFESPTQEGHTYSWSRAGVATQGVPNAFVREVQTGTANKSRGKKVAYVVYCSIRTGVFRSWRETQPLVNGVSNCIYRGYTSLAQAEAAFSYALQRSWPITSTADPTNPINGSETCDDKWYVVYHGITPGVYRSHLECQLNTLGVRGALHKGIIGRAGRN
ncbi:hypothetical protein C8R43DRAFT_1125749 [Mycena crocata]|nr:hypothetical protein C8R43DRAFT_1125749 [Mycena crocata]